MSGFSYLERKLSDILPADITTDSDFDTIDAIWLAYLEVVLTNIRALSNFAKPNRIPVLWLNTIADELNIEYTEDTTEEELRRLIYQAVPQNKQRNTITDILRSLQVITGIEAITGLRPVIIEGFAQDNEVGDFHYGILLDQDTAIQQTVLWYQGGLVSLNVDLGAEHTIEIQQECLALIARKKIATSIVSVGWTDPIDGWQNIQDVYSTDLSQVAYGTHEKRFP